MSGMVQYDSKPPGWVDTFRFIKRDIPGTFRAEFFCSVDCWCGSTLSSGEYWPSMKKARDEAAAGLKDHNDHNKHAARVK